jgi:wobble nucleotide-excising tRNase
MPYFREEDRLRKENTWSDEAHSVLVLAIQTIDKLGGREEFPDLRQRLDLILNSEHWKEKRSKEENARLNWYATQGGYSED